jgi:hypothetical protein
VVAKAVVKAADLPLSADMFHSMSGWATKIADRCDP